MAVSKLAEQDKLRKEQEERQKRKYARSVGTNTNDKQAITRTYKKQDPDAPINNGGFWGGVGYLGEKLAAGTVQSIEGMVDYIGGGFLKFLGDVTGNVDLQDQAYDIFNEQWWGGDFYRHADEWYNPDSTMKVAGDVFGGIGTSLPAIGTAAAITAISHGAAAPWAVGLASAGVAGLGAAGGATSEAVQQTGKLGWEELGYGAMVGATEGAIEYLSAGIGAGTGRIVKNIATTSVGKAASQLTKRGMFNLAKELGKDFVSEAAEEAVAEIMAPVYARMTYNPDAELASAEQVWYAAFVGGMSGILMGGAGDAVNAAKSRVIGGNITKNQGEMDKVLRNASRIAELYDKGGIESDTMKSVSDTYQKLQASMAKSKDGKVTSYQKKLVGDLAQLNTAATFETYAAQRAYDIVQNIDAFVEKASAYKYTDPEGNPITVTKEALLKGVEINKNGNVNRKSLIKAIRENRDLQYFALMDMAGRMQMDTAAFTKASMEGVTGANDLDLARYLEQASPEQKAQLASALGYETLDTVSADDFNARVAAYAGSSKYQSAKRIMEASEARRDDKADGKIPKRFAKKDDGTYVFESDGTKIAVTKEGDTYSVYDYTTEEAVTDLSKTELNRMLGKYAETHAIKHSAETTAATETTAAKPKAKKTDAAVTADIEAFAKERVKGYSKLLPAEKTLVRRVIRQGKTLGVADDILSAYANVCAHAKILVQFKRGIGAKNAQGEFVESNGYYDRARNVIVANPNATNGVGRVLIHELDHAIRTGAAKGGKDIIYFDAIKGVDEKTRKQILDQYGIGSAMDETNAYYAETVLSAEATVERLVADRPSLKDKILGFFSKAKADYKDVPFLDKAAESYYQKYKKMFDKFAERNAGGLVASVSEGKFKAIRPSNALGVKHSLPLTGTEERQKIDAAMTMNEAKRMIETAYKVHGIAEYYEGEYENAEDWLRKAGPEEVEMYIENDYDLQAKYVNSNEDILDEEYSIADVLEAYLEGTLIGKTAPKPKRLDLTKNTRIRDDRFYAPKQIEEAKSLYEIALKKAVGKDAPSVIKARAKILLFSHNKGAAELLGVSQSELNKKLRSWSNYSATSKRISERINEGVADENRWTGIENCAYISKATVSDEDVGRLVSSIEGESRGYERRYIARVMLAADTHIDYTDLNFKFASSDVVNADHSGSGRVNGFYRDESRLIEVSYDKPNTVAHEMGHYIDAKWGRDLIGSSASHLWLTKRVNSDIVRDRYGEPGVTFLNNFRLFVDSLASVNDNRSSYTNDRGEIFARFFARFVEWTDNIATGNRYYSIESSAYSDKFTTGQFLEFAKLLQEKALLDGILAEASFKSEQAKMTTNKTPTLNKDIKHSLPLNSESITEEDLEKARSEKEALQKKVLEAKKKADSLKDASRESAIMDLIVADAPKNELNAALEEYKKWQDESGYAKAYDEYQELEKQLRDLRGKEDAIERELTKRLKEREYTEEEKAAFASKAARKFRTTSRLSLAGYLTTNGSMLDFSQRQGYRVQDHREISDILDLPEYAGYSDGMIIFMNMGNIRLQTYGIDISAMPNAKQITALRSIIPEVMREYDEFTVDFSKKQGYTDGSVTYPRGIATARIISDIKSYFETGVLPEEPSNLSQFRKYSLPLSAHATAAVETFGTTSDVTKAGFVLPDGRMLHFERNGGVRHDRIAEVYDGVKGDAAVNAFIQEGNVRIKATAPGIEISSEHMPTVPQRNALNRFISRMLREKGRFYVDITDVDGRDVTSMEYDSSNTAEDVMSDIRGYYGGNVAPAGVKHSVPIDKRFGEGYNLYTATDDFKRQVLPGDQHAFARSLADKTSDMKTGEHRLLCISNGLTLYWFFADDYMHGRMVSVEKIDPEEWQGGHKEYGTIHENAEIDALWNEDGWSAQARRSSNVGDSKKRRGTSKIDSLHEGLSRSDTTGDFERGSGHPRYTRDQVKDMIRRLKDEQNKLGSTKAPDGVKNSLPLDADYMKAVESGDMETAQKMVDGAANEAGYGVTTYHGTDKDFTVFKTLFYNEFGYHVGTKKSAEDRVKYNLNSKVLKLYTKLGKTIRTPDVFGYFAGMHDYIFYVRGEVGKVSDMDFLKQYGRTKKLGNKFPHTDALDRLHNAYVEFVESGYKHSKGAAVVELTQEYLKGIGVDSIAYSNAYEAVGSTSYLLMNPNQVKSADPVTYANDGSIIPLSQRFNKNDPDIRYSLPLDTTTDGAVEHESRTLGVRRAPFDAKKTLKKFRGYPTVNKMSVGEIKKIIANNTKMRVYSKKEVLEMVNKFTNANLVKAKTINEVANNIWQLLNDAPDPDYRELRIRQTAEFIAAKFMTSVKLENPNIDAEQIANATYLVNQLDTYLKGITFGDDFLAELGNKTGTKTLLAGKTRAQAIINRWGAPVNSAGVGTPIDVMLSDVLGNVKGFEGISEMSAVDALLYIDSKYRAAKQVLKKQNLTWWEAGIGKAEAFIQDIARDIRQAFDSGGERSTLANILGRNTEYYIRKAQMANMDRVEAGQYNNLYNRIVYLANRMKDLKADLVNNATQGTNHPFKGTFETLSGIIRAEKMLTPAPIRQQIAYLHAWYVSKPTKDLLGYKSDEDPGVYSDTIAAAMETIALAEDQKAKFSVYEMQCLDSIMSHAIAIVKNYQKVWKNGKLVDALPEAEKYIEVMQKSLSVKVNATWEKVYSGFLWQFGTPVDVMAHADKFMEGGFFSEMLQTLRDAAENAAIEEMNVLKEHDAFIEKHKNYVRESTETKVKFRGQEIPRQTLITLYMTAKREHAWAGLVFNGAQYKLGNLEVKVKPLTTEEELTYDEMQSLMAQAQEEMAALLTETDKEYIAILEKGYNLTLKEIKIKRDMERMGFTNAMDGYYIPLKRANMATTIDQQFLPINTASNSSFNKNTVKGAAQALELVAAEDLFLRHAHEVCQYAFLSPAIESFDVLWNIDTAGNRNNPTSLKTVYHAANPDVVADRKSEKRENAKRGDMEGYFRELIQDIQGTKRGDSNEWISAIRGGYATFQLGANPKVWMTQLSSIFASLSELDAQSVFGIGGINFFSPAGSDVDLYCPLAELRNHNNDAASAQAVMDMRTNRASEGLQKVRDVSMAMIGKMDRIVVMKVFIACQKHVAKHQGLEYGTEANKIAAGKLLKTVIENTQQGALATEKSKAARGGEIMKTFTMFRSDAIKVMGRVLTYAGNLAVKIQVAKSMKANAGAYTAEQIAKAEADVKAAGKKFGKSMAALVSVSAFMTFVSWLFRHLYNKDEDKPEEELLKTAITFGGSFLGGLPIISDIYSSIVEGFAIENFALGAANDLVEAIKGVGTLILNSAQGKASSQDWMRGTRDIVYAVCSIMGLPVRNVWNTVSGAIRRVNSGAGKAIDNVFYPTYASEFKEAIEAGDDSKAYMIMQILTGDRLDGADSAVVDGFNSLNQRLLKQGKDIILPADCPASITVGGKKIEFTTAEQAKIQQRFASKAESDFKKLFASEAYKSMTAAQKRAAVAAINSARLHECIEYATNKDTGDTNILGAKAVTFSTFAQYKGIINGIESDKDKDGNTISGSKRAKVVTAIKKLKVSDEQKLFLIMVSGYTVKAGDFAGISEKSAKKRVASFIAGLSSLTKAEKEELAKKCGFEVKNGVIQTK